MRLHLQSNVTRAGWSATKFATHFRHLLEAHSLVQRESIGEVHAFLASDA